MPNMQSIVWFHSWIIDSLLASNIANHQMRDLRSHQQYEAYFEKVLIGKKKVPIFWSFGKSNSNYPFHS